MGSTAPTPAGSQASAANTRIERVAVALERAPTGVDAPAAGDYGPQAGRPVRRGGRVIRPALTNREGSMTNDVPQAVLGDLQSAKTVTLATASSDGLPHARTFMYGREEALS
jgi:Pyridoxamine 5'-phosphate oxidase